MSTSSGASSVNSTSRASQGHLRRSVAGSLLLLCLICLPGVALAQTTFFKSYGGQGNDQANSVIPVTRGTLATRGVVVAGFTEENLINGSVSTVNRDAWVLWIRPDGTVAQGFKYGLADADEVINEIEEVPSTLDPVGGYIAIGTRRMRTGTNSYSDILLIRIKPDGTVKWEKTYSSTSPHATSFGTGDEGLRVECDVLKKSGHQYGFILSGRSQTENGGVPEHAPNAYIIKVDNNGSVIWERRFEDNDVTKDATFGDVRVTPTGYVFSGFNSPGTQSDNDPFYGSLSAPLEAPPATGSFTVNRYGNPPIPPNNQLVHQGTYSILPLASTTAPGFFSVGNWRTNASDMHIFALNMDSNLASRTFHFYGHQDSSRVVRSEICKGATYIGAPAVIAPISEFYSGAKNDAGLILMDENGVRIWARQYGTTRSDISLDACQQVLDSNSFYAVGNTTNTNGNTDLLVIKTDREGKLQGTDQACVYLAEALQEQFHDHTAATVDLNIDEAYSKNDATGIKAPFAPTPEILCETPIVNACTSEFTAPDVCRGKPVAFTNASTGATTWNWNFGDGNTATQQNPTHTYTASGSYAVTLSVNGGACTVTHNVIVGFDCFPSIAFDDDKARFDNFAIELHRTPDATGYIVVYGGRRSRADRANLLGARTRRYLIRQRGIDPNRVVIIDGGRRQNDYIELWIVPRGAQPPQRRLQPGGVR